MKRVISVLLALLLVVGLIPMAAFAEEAAQFTFSVDPADKTQFAVGDMFKVTLNLTGNTGFGGMTLKLKWNDQAVRFTGFDTVYDEDLEENVLDSEVLIASYSPTVNYEKGNVTCSRTKNITKNGKIFTANFEVTGEGDFQIGLKDGTDFEYIDQSRATVPNEINTDALANLTSAAAPLPKLNAPSVRASGTTGVPEATETSVTAMPDPDFSQMGIIMGCSTSKMVVEISKTEDFAEVLETKEKLMSVVMGGGDGPVFVFDGLEDGTEYYLRAKVTSVDGYQDSDYSAVVKVTTVEAPLPKLGAPTVRASGTTGVPEATQNSVTAMPDPDFSQMGVIMGCSTSKMVVEISKTENFAEVLETKEKLMSVVMGGGDGPVFVFDGLEDGTDYYLRAKVTSVDGYQDSDYSAVVKATTVAAPVVEGYTVTMPADISIVTGETASIPVVVDNADGSAYNAFDMSFTYDASKLELTSTEIKDMTVTYENGTVRVQRYGSDLSVGSAAFTLTFKAKGTGETTVTATEAKVGIAENAHELDAADATILDDATVITIGGYSVNLPDDFTGESTVAPGEDYTFEAKDKNYNYDVTAKIGDTEITVNDNEDGTFTIPADQITGNIVITSTKEGKTFDVSLGADMTHTSGTVEVEGVKKVQYMTDYKATLTKADGYTYDLKVKIGDADYTGFTYDEATGVVTIPGADITGKIEFNSNKNKVQPTEYTVTFEGNGAGDVAEGAASKVEAGADYSFALNKAEGHTYTVSYKMGDSTESVALTEADGKYTIEKVNGNLVITVEKESDLAVEVSTYVELDDKTVFLVRATGTLADGKAYAYNGDTMYYSNVYQAWSWLVIVEEGNTFTADDAKANITAVEAEYTTLDQTFDVNMTSKVDVNDAQLVYNIYNCEYSDFSVANMQKFLYADTNGDKIVDTLDAAAVVNNIPKA